MKKKMMKNRFLSLLFVLFTLSGSAQYQQEVLYPGQDGEELVTSLKNDYKPGFVPDYGTARDHLYRDVYFLNDSVRCVYSGHALYLPPGVDPSVHLGQNGNSNGINTEHTYPRSKGADSGNPKSDMHHLFPTRANVNTARSNAPFLEIEDSMTVKWFYKTFEMSAMPSSNIDQYSEVRGWSFEPREDHKGNTARAIFYFYTMYRDQAMNADPSFFNIMRPTLCQWHIDDPVDSLEYVRTYLISQFQDDKVNPFILDCTLPQRTYCQDTWIECLIPTDVTTPNGQAKEEAILYPNPLTTTLQVQIPVPQKGHLALEVYNMLGQVVGGRIVEIAAPGTFEGELSLGALPTGMFVLQATLHTESGHERLFTKTIYKMR